MGGSGRSRGPQVDEGLRIPFLQSGLPRNSILEGGDCVACASELGVSHTQVIFRLDVSSVKFETAVKCLEGLGETGFIVLDTAEIIQLSAS